MQTSLRFRVLPSPIQAQSWGRGPVGYTVCPFILSALTLRQLVWERMYTGLKEVGQSLGDICHPLGVRTRYDLPGLSCGAHVWVLWRPVPQEPLHCSQQCSLWLNLCHFPGLGGTPTASFCWGPCSPEGRPFREGSSQDGSSPAAFLDPPLGYRLEKAKHSHPAPPSEG